MLQPPRRQQDPRETSGHDMLPWAINSPLVLAARRTYISVPILASYHLRPLESTSHIFWHSSKPLVGPMSEVFLSGAPCLAMFDNI
ncbi:GM15373 [Drosophila sechellia]|uniref:GM15373 n=1 Tax=Drosophila sechellia TaxID=7238 RepID=B4IBJ7_DROSE|nr:GM15373 [Drosophila sechellia]